MPAYDHKLGQQIHEVLLAQNLENPVAFSQVEQWDEPQLQQQAREHLTQFLTALGLHPHTDSAEKTAKRLLDFYCNDRFKGLNYANFPKIQLAENQFAYQQPLIASNIPLLSTCEHHLVPITGTALIAYCPHKFMVGLNKLNLVLNFFANRPQLQERLTKQVYVALNTILATSDLAVIIKAQHNCMSLEHIDLQSQHTTMELGGVFMSDPVLKAKLLNSF